MKRLTGNAIELAYERNDEHLLDHPKDFANTHTRRNQATDVAGQTQSLEQVIYKN